MKKTLVAVGVGLLLGIILSTAVYFSFFHRKDGNGEDGNGGKTTEFLTLEQIKEVAKIISVEYYMADVVSYQNNKMWPFSDQKILVIAKAKILAGFDLNKGATLTKNEISEPLQPTTPSSQTPLSEGSLVAMKVRYQYIITLPPPEIIAIQPNYKYYDIQGNPPPDTHTYILNLAKVTLYNAAKQAGILQKAKVSCQKQMQQIFSGFDVVIRFQDERTQG